MPTRRVTRGFRHWTPTCKVGVAMSECAHADGVESGAAAGCQLGQQVDQPREGGLAMSLRLDDVSARLSE
jgi:hypothetical protein